MAVAQRWQYIPSAVANQAEQQDRAQQWGDSQRQALAQVWADNQRAQSAGLLSQYLPPPADPGLPPDYGTGTDGTPPLAQPSRMGGGFTPDSGLTPDEAAGTSTPPEAPQGPIGDKGFAGADVTKLAPTLPAHAEARRRGEDEADPFAPLRPAFDFLKSIPIFGPGQLPELPKAGESLQDVLASNTNTAIQNASQSPRPMVGPFGGLGINSPAIDPNLLGDFGGAAGKTIGSEVGKVRQAAGEAQATGPAVTRRFYHGTRAAFERPSEGRFENGLFGPGYYLTDNPEVASSYAVKRQVPLTSGNAGPNVRAVSVPADLKLLDAEAPAPSDLVAILEKVNPDAINGVRTGTDLYGAIAVEFGSKADANDWLAANGYDGIRYAGGRRMPIRDANGKPIEHTAIAVFPDALNKLRNALSGTEAGATVPGLATSLVPQQPGESDEDYRRRQEIGAALTGAGLAIGRTRTTGKVRQAVEEAGRPIQLLREAIIGEPPLPAATLAPVAPKAGQILGSLPTNAELEARIAAAPQQHGIGALLTRASGVGKAIIGAIDPSVAAQTHLERIPIMYSALKDIGQNLVKTAVARLEAIPLKGIAIDDTGRISSGVTPKTPGLSMAWQDVFEHPNDYVMPNNVLQYIKAANDASDQLVAQAEAMGVKISKRDFGEGHYFGRLVREVRDVAKRSLVDPNQTRVYDTAEEAIQRGVNYDKSPTATAAAGFDWLIRKMVNARMAELVQPLGRTAKELIPPEIVTNVSQAVSDLKTTSRYQRAIRAVLNGLNPSQASRAVAEMENITPGVEAQFNAATGIARSRAGLAALSQEAQQLSSPAVEQTIKAKSDQLALEMAYRRALRDLRAGGSRATKSVSDAIDQIGSFLPDENERVRDALMSETNVQRTQAFQALISESNDRIKTLSDTVRNQAAAIKTTKNYAGVLDAVANGLSPNSQQARTIVRQMDEILPGTLDRFRKTTVVDAANRKATLQAMLDDARRLTESATDQYRTSKNAYTHKIKQIQSSEFAEGSKFGLPQGTIGVGRIEKGFASGQLFPRETADFLNSKLVRQEAGVALKALSTVDSAAKSLMAGFDFGASTIHLLPLLLNHPATYGRAVAHMAQATANPDVSARFMASDRVQSVLAKLVPHGLTLEGIEEVGGIERGGPIYQATRIMGERAGSVVRQQVLRRSEASFQGPLNYAKVTLGEALLPAFEREGNLDGLARFLNNLTGTRSSRATGISANQQAIEALIRFSPRFIRSAMALTGEMARGGTEGWEARRAIGSLALASTLIPYGLATAAGVKLGPEFWDPSSSKFLSVPVFGHWVSFSYPLRTIVQLGARSYVAATQDPSRFVSGNWLNNPLLSTLGGGTGPALSLARDAVTGKLVTGEQLNTPARVGERLAQSVTPFALQPLIPQPSGESVDPRIVGIAAAGLRTNPISPATRRNDLRNQLAQATGYTGWDDPKLDSAQKDRLVRENPELQKLTALAEKSGVERGQDYAVYRDTVENAKKPYLDQIKALGDQVKAGKISGNTYRDEVGSREAQISAIEESYKKDPRFAAVLKAQPASANPVDQYISDYYAAARKNQDPATGIVDLPTMMHDRDLLKQNADPEVVSQAMERINRNLDPEYVKAREQYQEMNRLYPRYPTLTFEQERGAVRFEQEMAQVKQQRGGKIDRGLQVQLARKNDPEGYKDYARRSVIDRAVGERQLERRKAFMAKNPLVQRYYSNTPVAEGVRS